MCTGIDHDPRQVEMTFKGERKRCYVKGKFKLSLPDYCNKLRYLTENTIKHEPTKKEK